MTHKVRINLIKCQIKGNQRKSDKVRRETGRKNKSLTPLAARRCKTDYIGLCIMRG